MKTKFASEWEEKLMSEEKSLVSFTFLLPLLFNQEIGVINDVPRRKGPSARNILAYTKYKCKSTKM